jgi:hypothetical protein
VGPTCLNTSVLVHCCFNVHHLSNTGTSVKVYTSDPILTASTRQRNAPTLLLQLGLSFRAQLFWIINSPRSNLMNSSRSDLIVPILDSVLVSTRYNNTGNIGKDGRGNPVLADAVTWQQAHPEKPSSSPVICKSYPMVTLPHQPDWVPKALIKAQDWSASFLKD